MNRLLYSGILFASVLIYNSNFAEGGGRIIHGRFFGTLNRTNLPFHIKEPKDVPSFWMTQILDHTNPKDNRTWNQRYFKNDTFYKPNGPICINIGGEGPADPYWVVGGEMAAQCSILNGMFYLPEHRFYGQSHPTKDASVKSLKYLSIEQTLADLNEFIKYIKSYDNLQTSKVILYGGSYAGTLAAYFAGKYPEAVTVSVASSAPINWKYDYKEYLQVVGRVINATSSNCYNIIKSGMQYLKNSVTNTHCQAGNPCSVHLDNLKLCTPLDQKNILDIQNLNEAIAGTFSYYVQYNGFMNASIKQICQYLENNPKNGTDFQKLANIVNILNTGLENECLNFSNSGFCDYISKTQWNDEAVKTGSRQWMWQVCNEVGSMQSTSSLTPFGDSNTVPSRFFAQQCQCAFGKQYTEGFIASKVLRHVNKYGADRRIRPRTIYVNGHNDPWSALGITDKKELPSPDDNPVILIEGASHCNDLMTATAHDSPSLLNSRVETFKYIKRCLEDEANCSPPK